MALFGKILTFLNLILAGTFFYLAGQDYIVRTQWAYSAFRHELVLTGLPIDEYDRVNRLPGQPVYPLLTKRIADDIFKDIKYAGLLGSGSVRTQEEEVYRVRDIVLQLINEGADEAAKRRTLASFLLLTVRSPGDRQDLQRRLDLGQTIADPEKQTKFDLLITELKLAFDRALEPMPRLGSDAATIQRDRDDKRLTIARLLLAMQSGIPAEEWPEWRLRVQVVCGVESYQKAISEMASDIEQMALSVRNTIIADQANFEREYKARVARLPGEQRKLDEYQRILNDQLQLIAEHETLVKARQAEVKLFEDFLAAAYKETDKQLTEQRAIERELFAIQVKIGETEAKNLRLEKELRQLEQKLLQSTAGR